MSILTAIFILVEAEAHLRLLCELLPKFCSIVKVSSGTFVKVDRNQDFASVVSKLDKEYQKSK